MSTQTDLFDSLLAEIYTLTNRPDLADETARALKTATTTTHNRYSFPRDSVDQLVLLDPAEPAYVQSITISTVCPRIRGLSLVQLVDVDSELMTDYEIDVVEVGDIRDPIYRTIKNDIAYLAGDAIVVKSSVAAYGSYLTYYQGPLVTRDTYSSWIAALAPDAIIYRASAIVLSTNGNEEKSKSYFSLVQKELDPALISAYGTSALR